MKQTIQHITRKNPTTTKMKPNDKDQKRKEADRIRQSNFRKYKETPEQAVIRKKKESIRSAERRKESYHWTTSVNN